MKQQQVLFLFLAVLAVGSAQDTLSTLSRAIEKCSRLSELGTCLRMKAVTLLDRAMRSGPLVINDYISLAPVADTNVTQTNPQELEASLPQDPEKKESALDDMIADKLTQFVSSRSIRFTIPPPTELGEGRKKGGYGGGGDKKGGGMMMMAAVAMGGMMMQMAMAKIALLAGKALLVGKMALLLSAIIGLKKLIGGGGGGGESHQVVYATEAHGGGHGWGRSAHDLAYSAQMRSNQARK